MLNIKLPKLFARNENKNTKAIRSVAKPYKSVDKKQAKAKPQSKAQSKSKLQSKTQGVVAPIPSWRYRVIGVLFSAVFISLIVRAVYLQIIDNDYLQTQGDARYLRVHKDVATRGMIVDRNNTPLAISTPVSSIWVQPQTILKQQDKYSYKKLSKLLGMSRNSFLKKCKNKKTRQFLYIKRQLSPQLASQIMSLDIPGVNSQREYKRYYPTGPVFGHVLGFTNIDNVGQEGMEMAFNKQLTGHDGATRILQDKVGHIVEYVEQISPVEHGKDLQLSLDARIQYLAHRYLQAAVKKHKASNASLVAIDVKTGEILAMVNAPDFNPNDRSDLKSAKFRNRSVTDLFEPGSTVKPFTVAMAMDAGTVKADTMIETAPGYYFVGRSKITDTSNHGLISVSDVIKMSSNIGAAKIALMSKPIDLYNTYRELGFGSRNNLKLPGEQRGILVKRKQWRPIEHATLSYGYGLSVNTLQLARSYATLANDGVSLPVSMHPVSEVPKGKRVFKSETVKQLQLMMEKVVSLKGTARRARIDKYRVAGKTGTAHRVEDGRYLDDSYMAVFAGFAPVSDPEIAIAVVVEDPKGADYYGGVVAAPVFASVMAGALRLRNIAPDDLPDDQQDEKLKLMISRPNATAALSQGAMYD